MSQRRVTSAPQVRSSLGSTTSCWCYTELRSCCSPRCSFVAGGRYRLPGALALIGAVAAPICDFVENGQTLDLLPADGEGHIASSALESLQHVSYLKWGLSAGTVFLIGFLFLGSRRTTAVYAVAALVYAVTLFGLAALVFTSPGWITIYFKTLGAILLFWVLPLCLGSRTWLLTGY